MHMKHWISLLLACALVMGVLSACGSASAAMGRYVEESIELPAGAEQVLCSAMNADGALVYYAAGADGAVSRYVQPVDGEASGEAVAWLAGLNVSALSEGPDGTVRAVASDAENKISLYYSKDGNTAEKIDMPDWNEAGNFVIQRGEGGGSTITTGGGTVTVNGGAVAAGRELPPEGAPGSQQGPPDGNAQGPGGMPSAGGAMRLGGQMPQGVTALADGFLVSYMQGTVQQYNSKGEKVREYGASGGGMGGRGGAMAGGGVAAMLGGGSGSMAVYENTLALADTGAQEVVLYDLATGKESERVKFEALDGGTFVGLDKDGLLLGDATGVYRQEGEGWKMAVDGGLTSLVMPTLSLTGLLGGGEGTYYAFLSGGALLGESGTRLVRFRYDESMPAQPDVTMEVFSLNDSSTVRLAIGEFQRDNPNVRVNLQVGQEGEAATTEDVVRALNNRLLAGKGAPDILILDGLPIQSFIEKGVLKDITDLSKSLDGLMQNLAGAYSKDGKVYGLPALFGLPAMVGDKDALAQFTSLEALTQAVKAHGEAAPALLHAPDNLYEENTGMLMDYYEACAGSFTNEDGTLDEAALAKYLTDVLALSDALKAVTPQSTDQRQMRGGMFFAISGGGGRAMRVDPRAVMEISQGNALAGVQQFSGAGSLMIALTSLGDDENMALQSLFNENQFYPSCGAGVVSSSANSELAEKFIATLLSPKVQDGALFDGFPVNRASLQGSLDELRETMESATGSSVSDMGFIALCGGLTQPLFTDETVKSAVSAQLKSLLDGSMTPEQAAAKIVADTKIYLAE